MISRSIKVVPMTKERTVAQKIQISILLHTCDAFKKKWKAVLTIFSIYSTQESELHKYLRTTFQLC